MEILAKIDMVSLFWYALLLVLSNEFQNSQAQQSYIDNKQLNCLVNDSRTLGFVCNAEKSCQTYLTFRSTRKYNSPDTIAHLLGAEASEIRRINRISDNRTVAPDTLVIVPAKCSCSGPYYQHNSSYVLKEAMENYFTVANVTYQGLTTCQSLIAQNPYNYLRLKVDLDLTVPQRCACPTKNQTVLGYKYLLSYLVMWGDYFESIARMFKADLQSIFDANMLSPDHLIFPFTPLLIPLKYEPYTNTSMLSPPPMQPMLPPSANGGGKSSNKRVFVGVGIGVGLLVLFGIFGFLLWLFCYRRGHRIPESGTNDNQIKRSDPESVDGYRALPESNNSWPEGLKHAVQTLKVYKYEQLQTATASFTEANKIKGSVFRGNLNGDYAAVKIMKGNVLEEINVLKKINHSNIIRLSGVCLHEGYTYLVYEYAERGSLRDLLHAQSKGIKSNDKLQEESVMLGWKQRIQVACDVADALNYLHNFVNPPHIHKNLNSSNILLDVCLRAKLTNFGLARTLDAENQSEDEGGLQLHMTRHVRGTRGYMAPEYVENGLVTPKLDVFAFGVVTLELLSGRDATCSRDDEAKTGEELLYVTISQVLDGENIREKLRDFLDPCLRQEFPLDMAYSMAQLARKCVAHDLISRPTISEVFTTLTKILSSSMDWDLSD